MFMRRAGRTLIATFLCGSLAAVTAGPMALAQNRTGAGLPSGSGNPMAQLQQQIDAVAAAGQDVTVLRQRLATLEQQMSSLYGLQSQINSLTTQFQTLSSQIGNGSSAKLAVYDSNQQKMGDVVGVQDNIPWVGLTAGSRSFVLQVFPDQLVGQFLWFDGSNCTGNVFISGFTLSNGPNVFALAAVHEPGGMVYAADANTAPVLKLVASVLDSNGTCSTFRPFNQNVLPASALMSLDSVFQRPYSVR
jgi:TolA-binding protein